jgi:hypothetical protein
VSVPKRDNADQAIAPDSSFPFGKVLDAEIGSCRVMVYRDLVRSSAVLTVYVAGKSVAATSLPDASPYSPRVLGSELSALHRALLLQPQTAEVHAALGAIAASLNTIWEQLYPEGSVANYIFKILYRNRPTTHYIDANTTADEGQTAAKRAAHPDTNAATHHDAPTPTPAPDAGHAIILDAITKEHHQ